MNPVESPPALLTLAEAAALCRMSKPTFWRRRRDGSIGPPPVRIGSKLLFRTNELREWIAAGMPPAAKWRRGGRA